MAAIAQALSKYPPRNPAPLRFWDWDWLVWLLSAVSWARDFRNLFPMFAGLDFTVRNMLPFQRLLQPPWLVETSEPGAFPGSLGVCVHARVKLWSANRGQKSILHPTVMKG